MDNLGRDIKKNFNNETYSDVIFEIDNQKIFGHKVILIARSQIFYDFFVKSVSLPVPCDIYTEKNIVHIKILHGVTVSSFLLMLEVIYSNTINTTYMKKLNSEQSSECITTMELFAPSLLNFLVQSLTKTFFHRDPSTMPNDFKQLFKQTFSEIKFWLTPDITFVVEDKEIYAHKAVVCIRCDYFR